MRERAPGARRSRTSSRELSRRDGRGDGRRLRRRAPAPATARRSSRPTAASWRSACARCGCGAATSWSSRQQTWGVHGGVAVPTPGARAGCMDAPRARVVAAGADRAGRGVPRHDGTGPRARRPPVDRLRDQRRGRRGRRPRPAASLDARLMERERALNAELRAISDYRRDMVMTLAHELRNPVSVLWTHLGAVVRRARRRRRRDESLRGDGPRHAPDRGHGRGPDGARHGRATPSAATPTVRGRPLGAGAGEQRVPRPDGGRSAAWSSACDVADDLVVDRRAGGPPAAGRPTCCPTPSSTRRRVAASRVALAAGRRATATACCLTCADTGIGIDAVRARPGLHPLLPLAGAPRRASVPAPAWAWRSSSGW